MAGPLMELEGTWEEIASRASDLTGHRLRVTVLHAEDGAAATPAAAVDDEDCLGKLIAATRSDMGVADLAREHDHFAHGKAKRAL